MMLAESDLIITHTISVPEVAYTSVCILALFYSIRLLKRSLGNLKFLHDNGINHAREYSATSSIWVFAGMSFSQLVYVIIGCISMMIPSPNDKVQPLTFVIASVFILASAVKAGVAFAVNKRTDILIDMLAEIEKERNGNAK